MPALMDFILYCVVNNLNDAKFYGRRSAATPLFALAYRWLLAKQRKLIRLTKKYSRFEPVHDFEHLRKCADLVMNQGVKMGEGWLIPAEMAALAETERRTSSARSPSGACPTISRARARCVL